MKVNIVFEMARDGGCSCYATEDIPGMGLSGYGNTPAEARADMLQAYQEISQIMAEEGKPAPLLDFVYHYDMKSFFKYFDFLNVSRVAQRAGINPSLMRKYAAGVVKAGEAQYQKLQKAISEMAAEMSAACF